MNDGTAVNMWQDGCMNAESADTEPVQLREVSDTDGLKALADPTRLAILSLLMAHRGTLRIMSVKGLAAELGEPQTKLYRHVRVLESADLIRVASSRMVSGILEQRYQANQRDLRFGPGLLQSHTDESEMVLRTMVDRFGEDFFAAFRAGRIPHSEDVPAELAYQRNTIFLSEERMSPAKALEVREKISELVELVNSETEAHPDAVPVNLLLAYYSPTDPPEQENSG